MSGSHWSIWASFLGSLHIDDPHLIDFPDPIPLLQVFAEHLRSGHLTPSHDPIRSRSVEDYVGSISQEIASLSAHDPQMMVNGKSERRLKKQLKGYARQDAPSEYIKPIPTPLVTAAMAEAYTYPDPLLCATGDSCGVTGLF
jgi:hypothetical protein